MTTNEVTCTCCGRVVYGPPLLEERNGDTYYLGDLDAGKALIRRDRFVKEFVDGSLYTVLLCDQEPASWENAAEWGRDDDAESAWRYALGAAMGPIDAEYDEGALRAALKEEAS